MGRFLAVLLAWLGRIESAFISAALMVLVGTMTAGVASRYGFSRPLTWTEELARLSFLWLIFVGAGLCTSRGTHTSVDFVVQMMPPRAQRGFRLGTHLLVAALSAVLAVTGLRVARVVNCPMPALQISGSYMALSLVAGSVLMGLESLLRAIGLVLWPEAVGEIEAESCER